MRTTKKEEVKEIKERESKLEDCLVLWLHKSKEGKKFLSGKTYSYERVIGFFVAAKGENTPKIRVYALDEDGKATEEIVTLWENESKNGKYLTGLTNEKEKLVGFYGEEIKEARPYVRVYFSK